jgi:hypothetical protein
MTQEQLIQQWLRVQDILCSGSMPAWTITTALVLLSSELAVRDHQHEEHTGSIATG